MENMNITAPKDALAEHPQISFSPDPFLNDEKRIEKLCNSLEVFIKNSNDNFQIKNSKAFLEKISPKLEKTLKKQAQSVIALANKKLQLDSTIEKVENRIKSSSNTNKIRAENRWLEALKMAKDKESLTFEESERLGENYFS